MAKVAINGMGRIGRAALKVILETRPLELVACNDLMPPENLAYLLKYDTVYGRDDREVRAEGGMLEIGGSTIRLFSETDPTKLPWGDLGIDLVFECTGVFTREEDLKKHLQAGARRVILSAPAKSETISLVVHGTNRSEREAQIISCASCTTNCIAPVVEVIDRRIGIEKATMTTVHAYTASQALVDGPGGKKDLRRGRAAAANLVPSSTGAAVATTKALPQLAGKFDGIAVRAPVPVGSIADIVMLTRRETSADEINGMLREEATSDRYRDVIGVSDDPLVSSDIIADPRATVVDLSLTQVVAGNLCKVMTWYDNEWGYVNQMIRHARTMA